MSKYNYLSAVKYAVKASDLIFKSFEPRSSGVKEWSFTFKGLDLAFFQEKGEEIGEESRLKYSDLHNLTKSFKSFNKYAHWLSNSTFRNFSQLYLYILMNMYIKYSLLHHLYQ